MNKYKIKFIVVRLVFFSFFLSIPVHAQTMMNKLKNIATGENGAGYKNVSGDTDTYFTEKIGDLIKVFLSFLGIIFLILMLYGGFLWMTAGGNETQVEKARKIIINSTIGLGIVMLSYIVTYFIVSQLGETTGFDTGI